MAHQNVTITLDQDLLMEARILAARRGTSVSGLIREQLHTLVNDEHRRMEAWDTVRTLIAEPRLEIGGPLPSRDELHER